jgi:RNA-splicing ligase RtcB
MKTVKIMLKIEGKYNVAKVYTDMLEDGAVSQIETLCNQEYVKESKIRIMPDVHAGAGCTIGTTMTNTDKVVPMKNIISGSGTSMAITTGFGAYFPVILVSHTFWQWHYSASKE